MFNFVKVILPKTSNNKGHFYKRRLSNEIPITVKTDAAAMYHDAFASTSARVS